MQTLKTYRIGEDGEVVKSVRDQILSAEQFMAQFPQVHLPVKNTFASGLYCREIMIPAGTLLTGKVHKVEDITIVPYGHLTVRTEDGLKEVKGPCTFAGTPGVKKIAYAHEDTLWINVFHTNETDIDKLEEALFVECDGEPHLIDFGTGRPLVEVLS